MIDNTFTRKIFFIMLFLTLNSMLVCIFYFILFFYLRRLPARRDCVQVGAELGGYLGPEILEALPV